MLQHNLKYLLCALHFAVFFCVIMPPFISFSPEVFSLSRAEAKFCDNFSSPTWPRIFSSRCLSLFFRHYSAEVEIKFKLHYTSLELKAIFAEATSCFIFVVHKSVFGGGVSSFRAHGRTELKIDSKLVQKDVCWKLL
jgi:hypothetical protein